MGWTFAQMRAQQIDIILAQELDRGVGKPGRECDKDCREFGKLVMGRRVIGDMNGLEAIIIQAYSYTLALGDK